MVLGKQIAQKHVSAPRKKKQSALVSGLVVIGLVLLPLLILLLFLCLAK